jgi:catechol 2,3-dioxygenase-like lactoylglutathione lyase family enzyme
MTLDMRTGKLADIASLDHVNIRTPDIDICRKFYVDALGFKEGFRPDFGYTGLWLYVEGAPVLHFVETDVSLSGNSGTIDHIAFRAHNFDKFTTRLKANKIKYEEMSVPGMDLYQVFCFDPHGIKVEFNFEGQDRPFSILLKENKVLKEKTKGRAKGRKSTKRNNSSRKQ